MYRGTDPPALVWNNQVYELPRPKKGGRKEVFVPLTKFYENIDREIIPGERKWRFEGEYEFGKVDTGLLSVLIGVYNKSAVVKWVPHRDFAPIKYDVVIKEMTPVNVDGIINLDSVKIKVVSKKPVFKHPTLDTILGCVWYNRVISMR